MGFWQGFYQGYQNIKEREERQAERDQRKAEIEEERAYQRKLNQERALQDRITATLPVLAEMKRGENLLAQQRAQLGDALEIRLDDVPEETRTAFTNIALQDPAYGESLLEAVQQAEGKLGRRMSGTEIVKMSRLFEQTKPEDVSADEWIKQAAGMTITSGSAFDFDATLEKLLSGEVSMEELQQIQFGLLTSGSGVASVRPDFDISTVMGGDPATQTQLRNLAIDTMKTQFQQDLAAAEQEAITFSASGQAPSEDWRRKNAELGRIESLDSAEREAAIFNYYAPTILPKLAEQEPRYKTLFPDVFQPATVAEVPEVAPVVEYEFVDGKLVPVRR